MFLRCTMTTILLFLQRENLQQNGEENEIIASTEFLCSSERITFGLKESTKCQTKKKSFGRSLCLLSVLHATPYTIQVDFLFLYSIFALTPGRNLKIVMNINFLNKFPDSKVFFKLLIFSHIRILKSANTHVGFDTKHF